MSTQQILREAMALPAEERARIADELLASLDAETQAEVDRAWGEEAERRVDAFDAGQIPAEDVEDVIKAMQNRRR